MDFCTESSKPVREAAESDELRCVIIDNNDSFTFNLYHYIAELGAACEVLPNSVDLERIRAARPTHLIISPGPGSVLNHDDFGVCAEAVDYFSGMIPVLGVCLGHQGVGKAFGMRVTQAPTIAHGIIDEVRRCAESRILAGLSDTFQVMRYHSLAVEETPESREHLMITARAGDGTVMCLEHRCHPTFGVQFHPESIATPGGRRILGGFLQFRCE